MAARLQPARAHDVDPGPRAVLRRPRPLQEHAVGAHPGHGHRRHGRPALVLLRLFHRARRRRRLLPRRLRQGVPDGNQAGVRVGHLLERRRRSGIRLHGVPNDLRHDHARADRRRLRRAHQVLGGDAVRGAVGHVRLFPDRALGVGDAGAGRSRRRRQGSRRCGYGCGRQDRRREQDRGTDRRRRLDQPGQGRRRVPDERYGRARLRGRHGRAHQRRHRGPRRRDHARQAASAIRAKP